MGGAAAGGGAGAPIAGKKRVREEAPLPRGGRKFPAAAVQKKRRVDDLSTWASYKETEKYTLRISELESQVAELSSICAQQKNFLSKLGF